MTRSADRGADFRRRAYDLLGHQRGDLHADIDDLVGERCLAEIGEDPLQPRIGPDARSGIAGAQPSSGDHLLALRRSPLCSSASNSTTLGTLVGLEPRGVFEIDRARVDLDQAARAPWSRVRAPYRRQRRRTAPGTSPPARQTSVGSAAEIPATHFATVLDVAGAITAVW